MKKILVVADQPITHAINVSAYGLIETASLDVKVLFVQDVLDVKMRGYEFDVIMIPESLKDMDELYGPLMGYARKAIEYCDGVIHHY